MADAIVELVGHSHRRSAEQWGNGWAAGPHAPDAGHHELASEIGSTHWAGVASLIETYKLNAIDPGASQVVA